MNNRQNEIELDDLNDDVAPETEVSTSHKTEKGVEAGQNSLFALMFGSYISESASNFAMKTEANFLFSAALFLRIFKLGVVTYNFITNKNKNLSESSDYVWAMVSGLALATVVAGSLFAAPVFALAAAIVFTTVFGLETLRNLFLTGFNLVRWGMLAYQTSGNTDPLTQLKYEKLSSTYKWNAASHGFASVVGLVGTAATAAIFLFPHIGVGAAIAGAVAHSVGGLGLSSGILFLVGAAVGVFGTKVRPYVERGWNKFKSLFSAPKTVSQPEQQPLLAAQRVQASPKFRINNEDDLAKASTHRIDHKRFMNGSDDREILIKHINPANPGLALVAIEDMVSDKIAVLTKQLTKTSWLDNRQEYKRRQKLEALTKIQDYLNFRVVRNDENLKIDNVDALVKYIDRKYPEVDQSFFRNESDTRNILKALQAYESFEKTDVEAQNSRRLAA